MHDFVKVSIMYFDGGAHVEHEAKLPSELQGYKTDEQPDGETTDFNPPLQKVYEIVDGCKDEFD